MTGSAYREELSSELRAILQYWMLYTPDEKRGGFVGRVDEEDNPDFEATKGLVLNARILWTFSAAWRYTELPIYRPVAARAYEYLMSCFADGQSGGFFWSVTPDGQPLNRRKQIYGQAFVLYGLSEYYRAVGDQAVLDQAIGLYRLIEEYSHDPRYGGYFEAFDAHWRPLEDVRLSSRDANEQKTMNTNLHVLEAYTNLYHAWPGEHLRESVRQILDVFRAHIFDPVTGHLGLFFSEGWERRSAIISYGHDIEAAWLLHAAAAAIGDRERESVFAGLCLQIAAQVEEGIDVDGGLWY